MEKANFGFMGLGVMGHMLALNMERNGFRVAGYDLDAEKFKAFGTKYPDKNLVAYNTLEEFLDTLEHPRRIMMMVPAGKAVDAAINGIKDALEPGDLLIDGGNTHFPDTERRSKELEAKGIIYIGTGVSGGEQGALWGPSIMPGGQDEAWELVKPIFEAISAKVDGEPCVTHIGPRGAGHYVKMVHNGIEYGDMQLIAESYDILHRGLGLSNAELHEVFAEWNRGELESYLIEITADIFAKIDPESGQAVVDLILDEAAQKGTGKWTSQNALDLGAPTPTINAAVESRIVSAYKAERVAASEVLNGPEPMLRLRSAQEISMDAKEVIGLVRDALYAAKICSYAQGFALMRLASKEYNYNLNFGEIARIWRGGCIIRARFLNDIREAFIRNPDLPNLMIDPEFAQAMNARQAALRKVVALAAENGIPALAFSSALAYFDAYRSARLPANLTQAQRDYFGAHTYRRVDREGSFHTEWQ
jgi:6-phosphogluconate dehydrogenase